MKVYETAWIYISEKFGKMSIIDVYGGVSIYEKLGYPTIPNFIYYKTPLFAAAEYDPSLRFFNISFCPFENSVPACQERKLITPTHCSIEKMEFQYIPPEKSRKKAAAAQRLFDEKCVKKRAAGEQSRSPADMIQENIHALF